MSTRENPGGAWAICRARYDLQKDKNKKTGQGEIGCTILGSPSPIPMFQPQLHNSPGQKCLSDLPKVLPVSRSRPQKRFRHAQGTGVTSPGSAGGTTAENDAVGDCPFHKVLNAQQGKKGVAQIPEAREVVETPGPKPMGLRSAWDVSKILRFGIQEAMLRFFATYGPVVR